MKYNKLFIFLFILMAISTGLFATTARYPGKDYEIRLVYNKKIRPGDPIFLNAQFSFGKDFLKKNENFNPENSVSGFTEFIEKNSGKVLYKSQIFSMKAKKKNSSCIACILPTNTYLKNSKYELKIQYKIADIEESMFTLPIQFSEREFIKEDIPLDQKNTAIKKDLSPERLDQIRRLNAIFNTKNYEDYKESQMTSFSEPLDCKRRTSFFGDRRRFIYTDGDSVTNLHYGIDYGVPTGTDVFSCSQGKVVMAENRVSTGWSVCIEHLPGLYSLYYHLDSLAVKVGDMVEKGTFLGKSGCTGLATGPHLHWEIRLNMEAVDPDWFVQTYPAIFLQEKERYFHQ
ncbi:MAG: M23 family metallopeptidase [Treponemataceae bacterium]|nr:M23 family metallopeptidase [Treponemataceae bacterium]